ncbi:hypothetical protein [Streptomyces spiralis]|uniref:hypothetical protein n=1 Tax=Streptomyces spiralis TaxID=66376 RepID=UPI0036850B55
MIRRSDAVARPVERRAVLLGTAGALLGVAGCTGRTTTGRAGSATPAPTGSAPSPAGPSSSAPAVLPRTTPGRLGPTEIHPEVKR